MARHRTGFCARSAGPRRTGAGEPQTWSGIELDWPVDGGTGAGRIVGTAGLRRNRKLAGYRGFWDLPRSRQPGAAAAAAPHEFSTDAIHAAAAFGRYRPGRSRRRFARRRICRRTPHCRIVLSAPELPEPCIAGDFTANRFGNARGNLQRTLSGNVGAAAKNVLPFRPISEPKSPALTPVENSAFNELARQLSARLEGRQWRTSGCAELPEPSMAEPVDLAGAPQPVNDSAGMAGAAGAAGARHSQARQGAARPHAGRRPDLSARPAAVCQSGLPGADRLRQPARARRGRRARRALCRTRRLHRQQHVRYRHAGDDFGEPATSEDGDARDDRRAPLYDFVGRRFRAGADLLGRAGAKSAAIAAGDRAGRRRPTRPRRSATPMPRSSPPSSTPPPKAS